jgi:hypothetical protein
MEETSSKGSQMDRTAWDRLISAAGAVLAVVLVVVGILAIVGGNFGRANVRDRLEPQEIRFPPQEVMSPEEESEVGGFAGQQVVDGYQAEAYSRFIELHLGDIAEGQTYAEVSAAARQTDDPELAAQLQGQAETLFRGETLRSILLNAYGWWMVATITLAVGVTLLVAGLLLGILAVLGFRRVAQAQQPERTLRRAA